MLHYVSSVGWLGVGLCQFTIDVVGLSTSDGLLRHAGYELADVFDLGLLLPMAVVSLVSGVVRATRSRWGLFRHWWVAVKLVLTAALMVGDPLFLGAWNAAAAAGGVGAGLRERLIAGAMVNVGLLTLMTVLSVFKPWGRIRSNRARGGARVITRPEPSGRVRT